jgi:hypothetical protein
MHHANRTNVIYSAGPTPMDWTRTAGTAFYRSTSRPTQREDGAQPLKPNPVADQSSKAPPSRPMQPESRYKRPAKSKSVKSTDDNRSKGGKHDGPSQKGRYTPSRSAGVLKRTSTRRSLRSRSKSILKAEEMRAVGST